MFLKIWKWLQCISNLKTERLGRGCQFLVQKLGEWLPYALRGATIAFRTPLWHLESECKSTCHMRFWEGLSLFIEAFSTQQLISESFLKYRKNHFGISNFSQVDRELVFQTREVKITRDFTLQTRHASSYLLLHLRISLKADILSCPPFHHVLVIY